MMSTAKSRLTIVSNPTPVLSGEIMIAADEIADWIEKNLFRTLPMPAVVIDHDFNIVVANSAFEQEYGPWQDRKCHDVYKNIPSSCPHCKKTAVFRDGTVRVFEDITRHQNGKNINNIRHTFPIKGTDGNVNYVMEITTDVSDIELVRQKYRKLFEHVPCAILVINRDYQIVEANQYSRDIVGAVEGAYCYQVLKKQPLKCRDCTACDTFSDGRIHSGRSTVISREGKRVELLVTTVPYGVRNGSFDLVLEMSVNITRTLALQDELEMTNNTMRSLLSSSLYGIISVDENGQIRLINQAAERMLNIGSRRQLQERDLNTIFPRGFLDRVDNSDGPVYLHETKVCDLNGDAFPARLTGILLSANEQYRGKAFWIHDIRRIKRLEAEKLEAERLAAVGKTVAGLAHGIKNVLTGLEGGEYMLNSGLRKGDAKRIEKGLEMLNRNTKRVSTFVKEFLNFSKGQELKTTLCDPVEIAREVVNTYFVKINQLGIELITDFQEHIEPVSMDGEGIHECLSNLLGNAIDACRISESNNALQIILRVFDRDNAIIYEVIDNGCGMDYEVKRKVFTTFFTTKGLGGTGLGLLLTKKVIQQHGGQVEFDSILDHGTTFRVTLPRDRLPELSAPEALP
jgi:PAS domain S-box-containing protein